VSPTCSLFHWGHVLLSLLVTGPLVYSSAISSLSWFAVWFLYLSAILSISFLTKGIFRSLWSVRLLTYRGASAIALSVLDWNL
jgi:hypothetical protein